MTEVTDALVKAALGDLYLFHEVAMLRRSLLLSAALCLSVSVTHAAGDEEKRGAGNTGARVLSTSALSESAVTIEALRDWLSTVQGIGHHAKELSDLAVVIAAAEVLDDLHDASGAPKAGLPDADGLAGAQARIEALLGTSLGQAAMAELAAIPGMADNSFADGRGNGKAGGIDRGAVNVGGLGADPRLAAGAAATVTGGGPLPGAVGGAVVDAFVDVVGDLFTGGADRVPDANAGDAGPNVFPNGVDNAIDPESGIRYDLETALMPGEEKDHEVVRDSVSGDIYEIPHDTRDDGRGPGRGGPATGMSPSESAERDRGHQMSDGQIIFPPEDGEKTYLITDPATGEDVEVGEGQWKAMGSPEPEKNGLVETIDEFGDTVWKTEEEVEAETQDDGSSGGGSDGGTDSGSGQDDSPQDQPDDQPEDGGGSTDDDDDTDDDDGGAGSDTEGEGEDDSEPPEGDDEAGDRRPEDEDGSTGIGVTPKGPTHGLTNPGPGQEGGTGRGALPEEDRLSPLIIPTEDEGQPVIVVRDPTYGQTQPAPDDVDRGEGRPLPEPEDGLLD